jgi:hypothetical protein
VTLELTLAVGVILILSGLVCRLYLRCRRAERLLAAVERSRDHVAEANQRLYEALVKRGK